MRTSTTLAALFLCAGLVHATDLSGTLAADTTLDLAQSPWHITATVTVPAGITLTVDPGVEVIFDGNFDLYVQGALEVDGTAAMPVSLSGNATSWRSLRFQNAADSHIHHAQITDGGTSSSYGSIYLYDTMLEMSNVVILNSDYDGVIVDDFATLSMDNVTVTESRYPVHVTHGSAIVEIPGSTSLTGNQYDQIRLGISSLSSSMSLPAADVAWHTYTNLTIPSGYTLTLEEGCALKLSLNSYLYVNGALRSLGTADTQNWITSERDDNVIGDTNGDGSSTSPAARTSQRIDPDIARAAANCLMQYTTVRFGNSSIYTESTDPTFEYCDFTNSHYPMHLTGTSDPVISNCTFAVATNTPIYMSLSSNPVISDNTFSTANNGYDAIGLIGETLSANGHLPVRDFTSLPNVTYVVMGNITVPAGYTLTIDPGVVIKFRSYHEGLTINGELIAEGTELLPIVMTSDKDDTAGNPADTNNDGSITAPAAGNWRGVGMLAGSAGTIDHLDLRYAGGYWHYVEDSYYRYAGLGLIHSSPTISNSSFFANNAHGLLALGNSDPVVDNCEFLNHTMCPIAISATAEPVMTAISFSNNTYTALGLLGERLGTTATLAPVDLAGFTNITRVLEERLVIESGTQFSVDPGIVLKMHNNGCGIDVEGGLDAQGSLSQPIVFTSVRDDNYGNPADTNNDANSTIPAYNNWRNLNFLPSSDDPNCIIDNCWIGYGGYSSEGSIRCESAGPTITNSTLHEGYFGISIRGGSTPLVEDCIIENCYSTPIAMAVTSNPAISFNNLFQANGYFALGIISEPLSTVATLPQRNVAGVNNFTYLFLQNFTIEPTGSLTFEEGVVAKFLGYTNIEVHGAFHTQGVPENRVYLSSWKDDAVGGDTNDDGSSTSPDEGNWGVVRFHPDADPASTLEQTVLRFGGYYYQQLGQVVVNTCDPVIRECEITNSYWSVELQGSAQPLIEDNTFVNLNYAPVYLSVYAEPTFSGNQVFNAGVQALQLRPETISIDAELPLRDFAGIENISYYLTGTLTVANTTELLLPETLVLKLYNGEIDVNGALIADGVIFTSLRDDTAGNPADTEDNGAGTVPTYNNWYGIDFNDVSDDATCLLSNCDIRYASYGVECTNAAPSVENTVFHGCNYGLYLNGNSPAVLSNVLLESSYTAPVVQSLVTDADYTSCIFDESNNTNGIRIKSETLAQDVTLRQEAAVGVSNLPWILYNLTVGSSSTLSIEPGVVVKCLSSSWIDVHKGFQAIGGPGADEQIVFTSIEDDFYGGDTNTDGNATEPTAGETYFTLTFESDSWDALCAVENCVFAYGGYWSNRGMIEASSANPTITDCSFRSCRTGISAVGSSSPVISGCDFLDMIDYAVYNNNSAITVMAENNYWGHDSGPLDDSDDTASGGLYNPGGLGERVSDYVDYDPWESTLQVPMLGDVSLNGSIHAWDASLILAWLADPAGWPLDADQLLVADVTAEGGVNATDAHYILQYVVGAVLSFPGETSSYDGEEWDPESELVTQLAQGGNGDNLLLTLNGNNLVKGFQLEAEVDQNLQITDVFLADGQTGSLRWHQDGTILRLALAAAGSPIENLSLVIQTGNFLNEQSLNLTRFVVNDGEFLLDETGLDTDEQPMSFALHPNHPNPFNPATTINFDLPKAEKLRVLVYNISGQMVRQLISQELSAGHHTLVWNGLNDAGSPVASGIYLLALEGEFHHAVRPMTLLK